MYGEKTVASQGGTDKSPGVRVVVTHIDTPDALRRVRQAVELALGAASRSAARDETGEVADNGGAAPGRGANPPSNTAPSADDS